ncbi:LCP family protein [Promicromonospora sp. NPDC057138]|uniref:LCP family protein n=1 Tax=Promicromonospora sp. NPDC057138 TaxID=3346031 RepID=UPI00363F9D0E
MASDFWTAVRPVGEIIPGVPRHARTGERQPRHVRSWRKALVFRSVTMGVVGVMAFGSAAAATVYQSAVSQIEVQDLDGLVAEQVKPKDPSDPFKDEPVNLLLMGTDIRDGTNADIGGSVSGMRSDTTMLVHISADRQWIEIVSIPRDSMVNVPACKLPGGGESAPYTDRFNSAFETGSGGAAADMRYAAACTINTVNSLTGVTVSNHAVVKMNGVIDVVDAIGGVKMCLPEELHGDPSSARIDLPAGENRLDGKTAIQFLRVRHGTGMGLEMGSDLTRIQRQQGFINALLRQILSAETLADPTKTFRLINAALGSLSADPAIANPGSVAGLAWSLRDIEKRNIIMTAVPVYDNADGATVSWSPESAEIFRRVAADEPPEQVVLPDAEPSSDPSGAAGDGAADTGEGDAGGDAGTGETGTEPEGTGDTTETGGTGTGETGTADGGTAAKPKPKPSPEVLIDGVCA